MSLDKAIASGKYRLMQILPYVIATLQCGASVVYAFNGNWRLALIWLGVGVSNYALAGLK